MAYTKILHIKNNTHLQDALNYITDSKKRTGSYMFQAINAMYLMP